MSLYESTFTRHLRLHAFSLESEICNARPDTAVSLHVRELASIAASLRSAARELDDRREVMDRVSEILVRNDVSIVPGLRE